jgi:GntR family transcriptional regulator, phosphonate transport system regulatory protein
MRDSEKRPRPVRCKKLQMSKPSPLQAVSEVAPPAERSAHDPVWRQVEAILFAEIRDGRYRAPQRLPGEHELAARFAVNRHTVRQALAGLVERGIVFKRKGGGSYLVPGFIDYAIGARTRFSANLLMQNREPGHQIVEARETFASERVARALELATGAPVAFMVTIGEADGVPISVGQHYFPAARFPGFLDAYREEMSTTRVLKRFGIDDYKRKITRVVATLPSEDDAKHLRQPRHTPVLALESIDVDLDGTPITLHETRFAGDRVQFVLADT